ncbi:MAG: T9SS type A sorting domain-containing protein [Bacteroidota bacterium]|jgi:hypothetical protein
MKSVVISILLSITEIYTCKAQNFLDYFPKFNADVSNIYLENETLYVAGFFTRVDTSYRFQFAAIDVKTGKLLPQNLLQSIGKFYPKMLYNGSLYGIKDSSIGYQVAKYQSSTRIRDTINWTNNSTPTVPRFQLGSFTMLPYGKYILMFANKSDWGGVISKGFYALDTLTGEFITNKFQMISTDPNYDWTSNTSVLFDKNYIYYRSTLWDLAGDSTVTSYTKALNPSGKVTKVIKDNSFLYMIGQFGVIGNGVHKNIAQINPNANWASTSWKPNNVGVDFNNLVVTSDAVFATTSNPSGLECYDKKTGDLVDYWQFNYSAQLFTYGDTVIVCGYYFPEQKYKLTAVKRGMSGMNGLSNASLPVQVSLYPNPVATTLKISSAQAATVKVYDVLGTLIYNSNNPANTHQLDVQHWKNGMYFVHIQTAQGTVVKKVEVIKE